MIERATLAKMLHDGMSQSEAARALGVSDSAISKARARWGIAYVGQQGPAPLVSRDEFRALWGRMSPAEIAAEIGCHITSVYARAQRMGLGKNTSGGHSIA